MPPVPAGLRHGGRRTGRDALRRPEAARGAAPAACWPTAPVVILDDPISQVDFETGAADHPDHPPLWPAARTILIASHRLSALGFADRIVVLDARPGGRRRHATRS
ncbi:MAG: hypothetical protein MZV70_60490 [Desulfobacterales bacterium]|nr:hypothetical protein [Desulfobacterales bacterium]